MSTLEKQWKSMQTQLQELQRRAKTAQGQARKRMKRLERRTRVAVARALRKTEPQVRQALNEAARVGRSLRAGVRAGTAAYRASARTKKK